MRRQLFVSSLLIAGSALCAPAFAQLQDKPVEAPAAPAANATLTARPAKPEPLLATPNGQVMDKARELAEADLAAAAAEELKPLRVDPNQARKRDFALAKSEPGPATEKENILAESAPEERPVVAEARPEPKPVIEVVAKPALAEAAPLPAAPRAIEENPPALAEHEAGSAPLRGAGDPVVKPVYAQRRYQTESEPWFEPQRGDPVVRPTYRERRWEPKPVEQAARGPTAESAAAAPRVAEAREEGRPDYVEAERIVRAANGAPAAPAPVITEAAAPVTKPVQSAEAASVEQTSQVTEVADEAGEGTREVLRDASRAARVVRQAGRVARVLGGAAVGAAAAVPVPTSEEERDERPFYAEDERDEVPGQAEDDRDAERAYPQESRRASPVYAEEEREAPLYAEQRRDHPPVSSDERPFRQRIDYGARFSSRMAIGSCDSHRFEGLARAVRRAAEVGSIDWRTARDMDDEIAHGEAMQRGYCASGMNDWRERRLDDQYTQIEDRLRFERSRSR